MRLDENMWPLVRFFRSASRPISEVQSINAALAGRYGRGLGSVARRLGASVALALAVSSCWGSSLPNGSTVYIGKGGAPFCDTPDQLQHFLRAIKENDADWEQALDKVCVLLPEGTKVVILANLPASLVGDAVQIRVLANETTAEGYSITLGYRNEP